MAEKIVNSRIIHKHDVEANWLDKTFTPSKGEIIVYDVDANHTYERFKIGDGKTDISALPFANGVSQDYVDTEIETLSGEVDAVSKRVGDTPVTDLIELSAATKANIVHAHDDLYYTETEVDTKLATKADVDHTHDLADVSVNHATTADTANAVAWENITGKPDNFAVADHEHEIADVTGLHDALGDMVPNTRTVNGKALSNNITLSASDVGADVSGAAAGALEDAKDYTDSRLTDLVGDEKVSELIKNAVTSVEEQIVDSTFYVTFTRKNDNTYTANKAYDEVEVAYVSKQNVMGLLDFGDTMLYHIPVTYYESGRGMAFHVDLESYNPITIAYGPDGTIVAQTYDELASMTYVDEAVDAITYPVTSVNGKTGAVVLTAENIGADAAGAADAALTSANSHTDTELARLVGDTVVSVQIKNALTSKADLDHVHQITDISNIGSASVHYAASAGAVAWANVTNPPSTYAPSAHSHAISDITNLQTTLNGKVPTSRTVNGKALSSNITLTASDIGADASGAANTALTSAKSYTDTELARLVGDTEVSTLIKSSVDTKADLTAGVYTVTATSSDGDTYTATVPNIMSLTAGVKLVIVPDKTSTSTIPTLNVNGLGAKYIARRSSINSGDITVGSNPSWLASGTAISLVYSNGFWCVEDLPTVSALSSLMLIVSSTAPSYPDAGTIWFQI